MGRKEKQQAILYQFNKILRVVAELKPEVNCAIGGVVNALMQAESQFNNLAFEDLMRGWCYSDGICCLIMALYLWRDRESYQQRRNKVFSGLLLLSGVQLIVTTYYNGFSIGAGLDITVGSFGFALSAIIDLGLALCELYSAQFRCYPKGWLQSTIKQLDRYYIVSEKISQKYNSTIGINNTVSFSWSDAKDLKNISKNIRKIKDTFLCKLAEYRKSHSLKHKESLLNNKIHFGLRFHPWTQTYIQSIENLELHLERREINKNAEIDAECRKGRNAEIVNSFFKCVMLSASVLFCLPENDTTPQIIAASLLGVVSLFSLGRLWSYLPRCNCLSAEEELGNTDVYYPAGMIV